MSRRALSKPSYRHFAGIPDIVIESDSFRSLSGNAAKMLVMFAYQYRGKNNGDLAATYKQLRPFGFGSPHTVTRAIRELLEAELIVQTRHGYFQNPGGRCALYALSWQPIDECRGKRLEVSPTIKPPRQFSLEKTKSPMQKLHKAECRNCTQTGNKPDEKPSIECRNCTDSAPQPSAETAHLIRLPRGKPDSCRFIYSESLAQLSADHPSALQTLSGAFPDCEHIREALLAELEAWPCLNA